MSQGTKVLERRWIILAQDGRHVTMGRAAPPSDAEIAAAAAALAAQGLAGWLAMLDGNYWSRIAAEISVDPDLLQTILQSHINDLLTEAADRFDPAGLGGDRAANA